MTNPVSPSDLDILHEFYDSTDGNNWDLPYFAIKWNFTGSPNPCKEDYKWYGLSCAVGPGDYSIITGIYINYANLLGTIPESFYGLTDLIELNLMYDGLQGTLSKNINQLHSLETLQLYGNHLSGSLPTELSQLANISTLSLHHNNFHGKVDNAFDGSIQTKLNWVQIGSNRFTGTIPRSIASLPSLNLLDLSWNCFHGSIPDYLCQDELTSLVLSGVNAADSCLTPFLHFIQASNAQSYLLKQPITGTIPTCLLELPHITEIQLDKVGLSTTIPDPKYLAKEFYMLNLGYNAIHGSIPKSIQTHVWSTLDLSYNKISGVLSQDFAPSDSLYLDYNRLTSVVPPSINNQGTSSYYAQTYPEILEGNAFSCLPDRSDLPQNDPYYPKYQLCGSASFNNTLYGAIGIVGASTFVLCVLYLLRTKINLLGHMSNCCKVFLSTFSEVMRDSSYRRWMDFIRRWACVLTAVILVLLIPLYATLSMYYATQTYKYAWVVSGVYLNGVVATTMIMLVPLLLAASVYYPLTRSGVTFVKEQDPFSFRKCWSLTKVLWLIVVVICVIANIILVVGVNTTYIAIARIADESVVQRASIGMSVFKIVWNYLIVRNTLKLLTFKSPIQDFEIQQYWFTRLETSLVLFNNIIAPYIATLLVSANCLQNALLRSTNGAFMYSYQCSSTFITTYASVFLFMFALTAVGFPVIQGVLMLAHFVVFPRKERSKFYACWETLFSTVQPKLLFPEIEVKEIKEAVNGETDEMLTSVPKRRILEKRLFCADLLVVDMVSMFAIMLTFGAVVPAVAGIGCIAILSVTLFNELMIGRGICKVNERYENAPALINRFRQELKLECKAFSELFKIHVFLITPFVAIFYGLLVFDMLGDTEGAVKAVWAPIVTFVIVVGLSLIGQYVKVQSVEPLRDSYVPLLKEDLSQEGEVLSPVLDL